MVEQSQFEDFKDNLIGIFSVEDFYSELDFIPILLLLSFGKCKIRGEVLGDFIRAFDSLFPLF